LIDPVEQLARDDKWQLGAGDGTLFAPAFPRWLEVPGFWDGANVLRRGVAPLFTIAVLDDEGREIDARITARRWTPAELTLQYRLGQGITATEVRTVHPGGIFVSEWRFAAFSPERIHLVAWTAQRASRVERGSAVWNGALQFVVAAKTGEDDDSPLRARAELACVGGAASWSAIRSEGKLRGPRWELTPFVEQWRGGVLPKVVRADDDAPAGGTFFAAVHRTLDVEYAGASATFAMRLVPDDETPRQSGSAPAALRHGTFGGASRKRWGDYFAALPAFRCSDPYIESVYWYRWYVLRVNAHGPVSRPADPVGAVRESRWSGDAAAAKDSMRAALEKPAAGDWGSALSALEDLRPDHAFVREMHAHTVATAEWLLAGRDRDASGLFDLARDDESAEVRTGDSPSARLKGIETTVYAYALFRWLERAARLLDEDSPKWTALAERTRAAVRERMWNASTMMFSDVDAKTMAQTNVKHARCFTPYRTDIVSPEHVAGLEQHLLNPAEFFTAFPVPSLAADDPRFSAEGEWKSRRGGDPFNGRSHPGVTAEIVDAVARVARTHAPHLRGPAATLLRRFVRTMFHDGDLHRVNSHEHYNPLTGYPSVFRGADDVQRGWLNDLIIGHVMGITLDAPGITIDPLPFGLEYAEISGVRVRGRTVDVRIDGPAITATIDGVKSAGTLGTAMVFATASTG
jgi:hypothetical protein